MTPLEPWELACWVVLLVGLGAFGTLTVIAWWGEIVYTARLMNRWLFPQTVPVVMREAKPTPHADPPNLQLLRKQQHEVRRG